MAKKRKKKSIEPLPDNVTMINIFLEMEEDGTQTSIHVEGTEFEPPQFILAAMCLLESAAKEMNHPVSKVLDVTVEGLGKIIGIKGRKDMDHETVPQNPHLN